MTKYFKDCKTCEDVKATFKDLAKKLHPDNGGNAEQFKIMMQEYTKVFNLLKNIHFNAKGERYEKETHETPEEFADIINNIIFFEDITIEIIGSWVWVSGNTQTYKEELKKLNFKFSGSKKAWYFNGDTEKKYHRGYYTMKQLRERWGCEEVETKERKKIS